jgi:putative transposase
VNRNKKLPVVAVAHRDEAARLAELPAEATVAPQDVAAAIKDGLMAFCCSAGLAIVAQLMETELTEKVGPKGRHDPERVATRNGSAPGSVTLGGRIVPVRRPRATKTEGGEVQLDSYALFSGRDLLTQVAVERMLAVWQPDVTVSSQSRSAKGSRKSPGVTRSRRSRGTSSRRPRRRSPSS